MEKLIVKNFGPIKEAEIDLTKYVVFIGDTSTGKSVLAKLIAIFRDNDLTFSDDRLDEFKKMLEHYSIDFNLENAKIEYYYQDSGSIIFSDNKIDIYNANNESLNLDELEINSNSLRKKHIIDLHDRINNLIEDNSNYNNDIPELKKIADDAKRVLGKLISINKELNFTIPIYIPAERILTSVISSTISGLWANNVLLSSCYKDFAAKYDLARKKIKKVTYKDFNLNYSFKNDLDYIKAGKENLLLTQSSSGIQSLTPLLLVLDYEISYNYNELIKTFLIEEPELNLFPIKQKLLLNFVIQRLSGTDNKLIITTHSPYILSVFDTLILAKNTFNENPKLKKKISFIVNEDKWIDYNDISVYEVKNDGTIQSIKNEEFKSIDTNAIDRVSDIISEEFDKLTELRYAQ